MLPSSNFKVSQLSSTVQTHRASVLSAIASKNHQTAARVVFLKSDAARVEEELAAVPDDTSSRLDWINRQLSGNSF